MITLEQYLEPYGFIYQVTNLINGKIYIGQTTNRRGIRGLMTLNSLKNCYKDNLHLISSFKKYGIDNFKRDIIDSVKNKEKLDEKEVFYIRKFNTLDPNFGYNIRGGGSNGKLSNKTKKKMSKKRKGEKNPMYGKHHSKETKQKISEKRKGKKTYIKHIFTKKYLIIQYWKNENCMKNNLINIKQKNIAQIAKENNCHKDTIKRNLMNYKIKIRDKKGATELQWLQRNKN